MSRGRRWLHRPRREPRASRRALLAYAVGWLVAAAVVVGAVVALTGGGDDHDTVSVPPVRETELVRAAALGGCRLTHAGAGERLNPAVDGPPGARPAEPGFYDRPIASLALIAAIRRGTIVIQYRRGLEGELLDALKSLQAAVPAGTIVAPNATGMGFELAVTAYRRMLACPRFSLRALDAVQLFRGRFVGSGPDS
jgi:Protein of unknown function (DUF3105)